jgi:hypothetical protein
LRLNRRLREKFKMVLDDIELRELPLHGRKFTWSSNRSSQAPTTSVITMTIIDRMFCTTSWEDIFPTAHLQAWASTVSHHCPLILQGEAGKAKFKAKLLMWFGASTSSYLGQLKHLKMGEKLYTEYKIQFVVVKEVICLLDQAQERRNISHLETDFKARLKEIYLGLLTVEKLGHPKGPG